MPETQHAVLVTGAGRRLGYAIARSLIERRVPTAIHYHASAQGATELLDLAARLDVPAVAVAADLQDADQTLKLWRDATDALGPIDWLVNNASVFEDIDALKTTLDDWDRNLHVNLRAPFLLSQALAKQPNVEQGAIVNMLDYRATRPNADHFPYTISKAGLYAVTVSLAQALAPRIRVNGIALGNILPPADGSEADTPRFTRTPAKRRGTVEETVESVHFLLAGPAFVTGDVLYLTGGRHLT